MLAKVTHVAIWTINIVRWISFHQATVIVIVVGDGDLGAFDFDGDFDIVGAVNCWDG